MELRPPLPLPRSRGATASHARRHSRSASPLRSVVFQARCAADAMRLLGVPRYDVAGISYGGFVAYRMAAAEARGAVGRVVVMTSGVAATPGEMREMAAREERTVEEALLPETAEGLRLLVRRSMHRPPPWMPDFVLDDFIKVSHCSRSVCFLIFFPSYYCFFRCTIL